MDNLSYEVRSDNSEYIYFQYNINTEADWSAKILPHIHNAVEFKFVTKGTYFVEVAGERHFCREGDIIFVDSMRPHSYESVGPSEHFVLVVDKRYVYQIFENKKTFPLYMPNISNFNHIKKILLETFEKWDDMSKDSRKGFVYRIIGTLMQFYKTIEISEHETKEELIVKILEYIDEHYKEDITLKQLSDTFGYSKNYFSNVFNKYMKMGLRECVNRVRVKKAVLLMHENNKKIPMWRVAELCGFNSFDTFSRAYKRFSSMEIKE